MSDAANPAAMAETNLGVKVRDFNLWYGDFQALYDVNLDIKDGIITSLIGPSGCGKTTLLRAFNRVNERYGYVRTDGEIKILGKNILDEDVSLPELRKSVGMDKLDDRATGLQLEQQQKLCIARLLPLKPRVILMDEPCSALDVEATQAVEDLMKEMSGEYTIIIVTHNMAQARRVSDECIFMLLGEIIEHGDTAELFLSPQHEKTSDYIEGRYG